MWILMFLACGSGQPTPNDTDTDTDAVLQEECLFDLDLWCANDEGAGGPNDTAADCETPTVAGLMAERASLRLQCEDPVLGTIEVVNEPTGYGGSYWYFDASGTFVAYTYATDINVFCEDIDGGSFQIAYGAEPACTSLCVLENETNGYDTLPPCETE